VALLLVGGLALCTLPLSAAGPEHAPASILPPEALTAVLYAAPLLASVGWWRMLWVSIQPNPATEASTDTASNLFAWLLVALSILSFVWSGVWMRLGEALARALGGS
jgi:hypothetical protein